MSWRVTLESGILPQAGKNAPSSSLFKGRAAENHVYPPLHRPARKNQGKSNKTQPSPRCPSAPFSLVLHAGSQRTSRRR